MKFAFNIKDSSFVMDACNLLIYADQAEAERLALQITDVAATHAKYINIEFCTEHLSAAEIRDLYEKHASHDKTVCVTSETFTETLEKCLVHVKYCTNKFQDTGLSNIDVFTEMYGQDAMVPKLYILQAENLGDEANIKGLRLWNQLAHDTGTYCLLLTSDTRAAEAFDNLIEYSEGNCQLVTTVPTTHVF